MDKLDKKNIENITALTPLQEGLLFHYLKNPQNDIYFEQLSLDISGEINMKSFEKAWNFVIETNEMLRTVFRWEKMIDPVQMTLKTHHFKPRYYDLSGAAAGKKKNIIEKIKSKDKKKKFDLQEVPFRITLCKIEPDHHIMIISHHHILYDGWSSGIILKEFFNAYHDQADKKKPGKPIKNSFKEYVKWLKEQEQKKPGKFWEHYLTGFDTSTGLPVKRAKAEETRRPANLKTIYKKDTLDQLDRFTHSHKVTMSAVLYSSWGILLQKYNNTNDVIFGTTVSGRSPKIKGIEEMVGLFINTIPLRVRSHDRGRTIDLLNRINQTLQTREAYESSSLVKIKEYSQLHPNDELFDSIVAIENYPLSSSLTSGTGPLTVNSYSSFEMTHYDLTVGIFLSRQIEVNFMYNHELFEEDVIRRLSSHFTNILNHIMENPYQYLHEIDILSKQEKEQVLYDFNDTEAVYPQNKTIHQLFAEQAELTPDHTALVGVEGTRGLAPLPAFISITYRELNNKSHQLAYLLQAKGVKPDTIVGIMAERSLEMIIGIFAILKADGAYLPIDPHYPKERINYILDDSKVKILVKKSNIFSDFTPNESIHVISIDDISRDTPSPQAFNNSPKGAAVHLHLSPAPVTYSAYILYTSGSTGKPKGVMVEHTSAVNILWTMQNQYPLGPSDTYLLKTAYVFDVSAAELFGWFFGGGRLAILEKDGEKDPEKILDAIERQRVTHINFVPSMFNSFVEGLNPGNIDKLSALKYIFLAGEVLLPGLVNKFRRFNTTIALENIYGPTEGTVYTTFYSLSLWQGAGSVPIGKPLANITVYILNKHNQLQPIGIVGELLISGVGLARGYLNNPELTAQKFLFGFFSFYKSYRSYKSYILYKTGDLARWLPDGNIEFEGRMDYQVKIRGFRIELGEIENQLLTHKNIKEALVIAKKDPTGESYLCGYITAEKQLDITQLRQYLSQKLPDYMVPSYFVSLEKMPLNPNGKIDRKLLPDPRGFRPPMKGIYTAPKNEVEKTIANTWKEVLGLDKVGIDDNFFDIGGHSLHIIRVNTRLQKVFDKTIPVVDLFKYPTVRSLANYLTGNEAEKPGSIKQLKKSDKQEIKENKKNTGLEIAVIGMSCRFPAAKNCDEFCYNLKNGVESISFLAKEEQIKAGADPDLVAHPDYVAAKGILADKNHFDAAFFNYTPAEAEIMDPQVRIFHECCWEALEDAGYNPGTYEGNIGLYAGASPNPYWEILPLKSENRGSVYPYAEQWNAVQFSDKDYLSTRIAYKLDLKGPCLTMQTACSTSLVAVDLACQGLLSGTCDIALAGGVSITFFDEAGYLYQEGTIMSPDGHCRAFDAGANGTIGGNGAGLVVLKRLEDAVENRDNIYAVIKGFGINNDGKNKVGFTAPSVEGQAKAIDAALGMAGIEPESIGYIEAHGTGTPLGDPIEIEALKQAFPASAAETKNYCALGSVKTNIGHLDAAAGIAGLIKTVLMLKHRFIPPSLHFQQPNPAIDFENSPFYVNSQLLEWENTKYPLRAGVSSFGLGGTNAHVILEEWPIAQNAEDETWSQGRGGVSPPGQSRQYQLILLSAKTQNALNRLTQNLADYLKKTPGIDLADAAYTLQVGRETFPHRGMLVCSTNNIREVVHALDSRALETGTAAGEKPTIIFMFSGQGSQYINMGLDLYQEEPGFRDQVEGCFKRVKDITGIDMKPVLYPDLHSAISPPGHPSQEGNGRAQAEKNIYQFRYTTPIKFIFEYSLACLLMKWGITPDAMIGHSFGEYVAACLSGVFSLEEALYLAVLRGELMHRLPPGAMLGVPLSEEELKPILRETHELSLAAVNGESLSVVSGTINAIDALEKKLNEQGRETLRFRVPKAGHSQMVEPILDEFREKIKGIQFKEPQIPYISGLTGKWITAPEAMDPEYWTRHLRETILFANGLTTLFKEPNPIFLQVGPDRGLTLFVNQHPDKTPDTPALNLVRHRKEKIPDDYYCLKTIGQLWLRGIPIDGQEFHSLQKCRRISLPTYPFESKCFNPPKDLGRIGVDTKGSSAKPLLTQRIDMADWFYLPLWEQAPLPPLPITRESVNWLVFLDELGLGRQLVKELKKTSGEVVTVKIGKAYARGSGNSFTLNPRQPQDYNRLFRYLKESDRLPHKILHLWSVMDNEKLGPGLKELDRIQERGFYSLLNIARAVGQEEISPEIQLKVVSNNMQGVTGEEDIRPEKATIRGAVKIIPLEYVNISCTSIDILLPGAGRQIKDKLVQQLLKELMIEAGSASSDNIIALRGNRRWRESMKPLHLEDTGQVEQRLKDRGIYLITGGLGGMGFTFARYLAQNYRARLILVGRSPFPDRKNWPQWLAAHPADDNVSLKIQKIQELELSGAEIMVCSADVSSEQQMRAVIAEAHQRFGLINGVLHTAGVGDYAGVIRQRTREMTEQVMAPKVKGTLVLEAVLQDDHPGFLVLFSSIGNIIYPIKFGQVGYSAANEFLEAFAYYKTCKDGTHTLTINWNDWLEVGMSIEATNWKYQRQWKHKYLLDTSEIDYEAAIHGGITPAQGVEVFRRILGRGHPLERVTVSMVDLDEMLQALKALTGLTGLRSSKGEGAITFEAIEEQAVPTMMAQRPHLRTPYTAPANPVEKTLSEIWSNYFGIQPIGTEDDFFELGGDSLKAMIMTQKIHKELGVRIPLVEFFNNPFIKAQAEYIIGSEKKIYSFITPIEKKEYYALSSAQQRIFILDRIVEKGISYNIPHTVILKGEIHKEKLTEIFQQLIQRHESLRTSFTIIEDEPVQRIHDKVEFEIEYYDLYRTQLKVKDEEIEGTRGLAPLSSEPATRNSQPATALISSFIRPFDLSRAPLLRAGLIKEREGLHILALDMHHIISDGTSVEIFRKELTSIYMGEELPVLKIRYKDFSEWHNREKQQELIKKQEDYWIHMFSQNDELPVLNLPTDFPRPIIQSFEGSRVNFVLNEKETKNVKEIAKKNDATLYMFLLSVFTILLSKLSGQEDIIVGTPIAARRHADLEPIIGMFVNTLAMRSDPIGSKTFPEFLKEVKKRTLDAYENQDYQFEELVDKISINRDTSRNPIFDVMFVLQNQNEPLEFSLVEEASELSISVENIHPVARFDIVFQAIEVNDRMDCSFEYCTKLFKKGTINRFINYFKKIIASLFQNPGQKLSRIDIITGEEKREILKISQGKKEENEYLPINRTIHGLFEEKAGEIPGNTAVVFNHENYSYGELNRRANQLSQMLRTKGIIPGDIVGIMMERSFAMIAAILAIMKAGAAYLPIGEEYPEKRILSMLSDSSVSILLTNKNRLDDFSITSLKNMNAGRITPVRTPACPPIIEFDKLPYPDRTLIDYEKYHHRIGIAMAKHTVSIQATRGCPYNCAFCHKIWPKKHAVRSAENIFKEILNCYDAGVQRFVFIDDIFNLDIKNSTRLFKKIIQHQLDIQLFFPNGLRGDILTTDFIDLMIEAGTVNIDLALESASPRIQKLIGKNLNLEKFRENVRYIIGKYPQVLLEMELMVGFPTETEEEALMTLEFLKDLKWVHFPNLNILKIYPNTEMYRLAVENGISVESIDRSTDLAYHQLPETLPFSKDFAKEFQTRFMKEYFLLKERLLHVLPYQAANFTRDEILQKYDSYLPMEIKRFSDILQLVDGDIPGDKLTNLRFLPPHYRSAPNFSKNIKKYFPSPSGTKTGDSFRVLLIDLSQLFSSQSKDQLYDVCVEPLGLMYLKTYLDKTFGQRVCGKVLKSRIDFDSFQELHHIISGFKPDLIGIRTLSCYKEFFHAGVLRMREWGIDVPIIAGGPYATSDYMFLLQDLNIDLVVLGEGELILAELVEKMMANGNKFPDEKILKTIKGIAFIENKNRTSQNALKLNREVILLDNVPQKLTPYPGENVENLENNHQYRGRDLVYVIYTSGSTGIPKAAVLEHRNVVNLMKYMFKYTNIDCSRILQFATISFDASFHEIFSALLSGGKLYLITRETRGNIPELFKYIEKNSIKTVFLPMSFLRMVFNDDEFISIFPRCVTHIQTAGEQVIVSDKFRRYLKKHNVYLHNHYGPAEAHVVTALTLDPRGEIPSRPSIGKPLLNTDIYILDKGNQLLPPGVPGELYIGGIQVGRGYLNKPQLTAEKFCLRRPGGRLFEGTRGLAPLLLKGLKAPGKRNYMSYMSHMSYLYRTGDLARWLPDGNIEFLGRIDNQVKIRGFRIEPGEIEKRLIEINPINEAVVIDRKNESGEKYLCAYVVTTNAGSPLTAGVPPVLDTGELIETLSGKLPDYMIPAYFVLLDKIPLTPNGKLNRKALPEPAARTTGEYTPPGDELEKKLAEIWRRVLDRQTPIGIDENFFQLGGHSLKAVIMTAKVHKELEIKISMTELFKRPTIRAMAEYTRKTAKVKFASPASLENKEYYPLSSTQTRMYFLNQMEGIGTAYNLPVVTEIRGNPDMPQFEKSFLRLIHRHESLRTSFLVKNETPVQVVHREADFQLENMKAAEHEIQGVIDGFIRPFNLARAPLFRVGLVEITGGKHLLLLDMHHIISDGISMVILIREFIRICEGRTLPKLQIQYKDYSKWQERLFDTPGFKKQEDYWLARFKGELPVLKLPIDYTRPPVQRFDGDCIKFQLNGELTGRLKKIASETDTTLFMILLAAFDILLAKYTGQEDIVVGIPAAGRNHPDLEHLIGLCVNTLAIRNYAGENLSFKEFLEQVKKNAAEAYENQDYPIEMLINKLEIPKELSQNPLFNILFVSENLDFPELKINELTFRPYEFEYKISHLDLVFYFIEDDPGINMTLEYAAALFKPSSIEKMLEHYIEILDQVGEDHRRILKDISISHRLTVPDAKIFQEAQVDFAF